MVATYESPNKPMWKPSAKRIENANLTEFVGTLPQKDFDSYDALWRWTNDNLEIFWDKLWDYAGVIGKKGDLVLSNAPQMWEASFFPNGTLNYAENMLRNKSDNIALISRDEMGHERTLTYKEIYDQVSLYQQFLKNENVVKGDRVVAYLPNIPETLIFALAAASLGAIVSTASPDFGAQGIIDRFGQVEPKILFTVNSYYYNGKTHDCLKKLEDILPALPTVKKAVVIPFASEMTDISHLQNATSISQALEGLSPQDIFFEETEFNHPLFIMFSSGTTGVPKCIVHGHGGTYLQHMKEHLLHCDTKPGARVFYFTTCGWMMWNWVITALACDATLMLYDGSPFYPNGNVLWEYASQHNCSFFGTSAKYIDALKSHGITPGKDNDLSALKCIASTGSPLMHESFDYVYTHIKEDVHLASIYGGTDIISASFGIGNPWDSVWRGELQGAALATAVNIFDEHGSAKNADSGAGELVCTAPIPSMPVGFWNDPDNMKFKAAYFEKFQDVWHHGDWVEKTSHNGLIVHGRSDATLNPGGVRIGTAEIYRQVEQFDEITESIAVGQDWNDDVRVILFVTLKDNKELSDELVKAIKTQIRNGASPRHVPAKIIAVTDIPRTKSNKIVELAVREVIHNRPVKNIHALSNPEALDLYKDLEALKN